MSVGKNSSRGSYPIVPPSENLTRARRSLKTSKVPSCPFLVNTCPRTNTGCPLRFVRRSRNVCCVSVVQENWPLELVPKIGVGIMAVHGDTVKSMYHTGKNGVKAGKTLARLQENSVNTLNVVGIFCAVLRPE